MEKKKGLLNLLNDDNNSLYIDINKYLSASELKFIIKIGQYADEFGINAYLVGGFVRDLLLGKKDVDIDITVEGDGIKFTEFLAKKIDVSYKCFDKFKTGKIFLKNNLNIDITSARTEHYNYTAALPQINFSVIQKDLYRRDFTINAMAIQINKKKFGKFIDFFNGYSDLKKGIIRILHSKSFEDDPTRILRAIRFAQRFGFKIEKNTLNLIKKALKSDFFEKVPGERLRDEIFLILREKNVFKILKKGEQLGIWTAIFKGCYFNFKTEEIWYNILNMTKKIIFKDIDFDCVRFLCFINSINSNFTFQIINRLKLKNEWRDKIVKIKKYEKNFNKYIKFLKNDKKRLFIFLKNFNKEELFYFTLLCGKFFYKIVKKHLEIYNNIKLNITGEDLKKLGIKEGPLYSKILLETLLEKIDGKIKTKNEEIKYIIKKYGGK